MIHESKNMDETESRGDRPDRSEAQLVSAAREGDTGAFEELVRMTQDRLYNLAFRMTGRHEDAEDALQEAYMRAHRSLATFEGGCRFYTWVYRIAVNTCLSKGRKAGRKNEVEGLSIDAPRGGPDEGASLSANLPGSDDSAPDAAASRQEEAGRVQEAIGELPDDYRTVVVLRDIEGLSYDEVGEVTGLTRAAVKSRLHRARQRLAGMLGDLR